jgi:hypothetical protein
LSRLRTESIIDEHHRYFRTKPEDLYLELGGLNPTDFAADDATAVTALARRHAQGGGKNFRLHDGAGRQRNKCANCLNWTYGSFSDRNLYCPQAHKKHQKTMGN